MQERYGEYIKEAYKFAAENSTDLSTQNGAILVNRRGIPVAWGANRFPRGVAETLDRLVRPVKYDFVGHAERFGLIDAARRRGVSTVGLSMFATWAACNICATEIIEAGIAKVVTHKKTVDASPEHWKQSIRIAEEMFKEAGVVYELWEGDIGGIELRFNEEPFRP